MKWRMITLAVVVAAVAAACADPSVSPDAQPDAQPSGALPPDSTSTTAGLVASSGSVEPFAGDWVLVSGVPIVDGFPITLTASVNEVGGRAACNQYGGSAAVDGSGFALDQVFMTEMACEPAVMDSESAYLEALMSVDEWSLVEGQLVLTGAGVELVFDRAPEVPTADVVGTTWVLETLVQDDMAFTTAGEPAMLLLESDGTVSGTTGCRTLSGRWIEANGEIVFPEFAADGECADDLWHQDNLIVTVLGDGFTAAVDGDLLTLTSMGNEGLVYRAEG